MSIENIVLLLHLQTRVCKPYTKMNTDIKHCGVIDDIVDGCAKVRIIQSSACASCKVAGHCNAAESKEKIVEIYDFDKTGFTVGDEVIVVASQRMGTYAVMLSSVIPLFLIIIALVIAMALTGNEVVAALSCLCALIPYYAILYLCRNRIKQRLSFRMERG